jgi:hypothetical protein
MVGTTSTPIMGGRAWLAALTVAASQAAFAQNAAPVLNAVDPPVVPSDGGAVILNLSGTGFEPGSVALLVTNTFTTTLTTRYIDPARLRAELPGGLVLPTLVGLRVQSPGGISNTQLLRVLPISSTYPWMTLSFQNGVSPSISYAGTTDTYISAASSTANFGRRSALVADGSPDVGTLLRWDLTPSALGSNVCVVYADITINVTDPTNADYGIYELRKRFTETSATWKRSTTGSPWQLAGAQGVAEPAPDRGSTPLGSVTAWSSGLNTIPLNEAGVGVVRSWLLNPAQNHGLAIQNFLPGDGLRFSSVQAAAAARPELSLVVQNPQFTASRIAANEGAAAHRLWSIVQAERCYAHKGRCSYPNACEFSGTDVDNDGFLDETRCLVTPWDGCLPGYTNACPYFLSADADPVAYPDRNGYRFQFHPGLRVSGTSDISPSSLDSIVVTAVPIQPACTGNKLFCAEARRGAPGQGDLEFQVCELPAGSALDVSNGHCPSDCVPLIPPL